MRIERDKVERGIVTGKQLLEPRGTLRHGKNVEALAAASA
jgi:hypothetical protein